MDGRLEVSEKQAAAAWPRGEGSPGHELGRGHGEKWVDAEILRE